MPTPGTERRDWTRLEVAATVSSYLEMLLMELRGVPYNKAQYRRGLLQLLNNRSEGAVERKHQNISAILMNPLTRAEARGFRPLA
jgi:site-specific recombinase XerC